MNKRFRYPGIRPFDESEEVLFFGRDKDIKNLSQLIELEKLVVLFGKSGYGKSSLIQAGIVPKFKERNIYDPVFIRFGAFLGNNKLDHTQNIPKTPSEVFKKKINPKDLTSDLLNKLVEDLNSFWYHTKIVQGHNPSKGLLIVLDQFEELFTYPNNQIEEFKEGLADLLNTRIPARLQRALKIKSIGDTDILSEEELMQLYQPLKIRILISIRSDRLSLLNRFADYLPNILQNTYELYPLNVEQASQAIIQPAQTSGEFESKVFSFDPDALEEILNFLSKNYDKKVETFQLQILCQYLEAKVIETQISDIDKSMLSDLPDLYNNYYETQIKAVGGLEEQVKARKIIEESLIFEDEERRLTIYGGQLQKQYNISSDFLESLVNSRLIRPVLGLDGSLLYELSHDSLVKPILNSKMRRIHEKRLYESEKTKNKSRAIIVGLLFYPLFLLLSYFLNTG